jgi:hypothetical protein
MQKRDFLRSRSNEPDLPRGTGDEEFDRLIAYSYTLPWVEIANTELMGGFVVVDASN